MKSQTKLINFLLLIFTLFLSTSIQAKAYRCVQDNGVVLYTDQPCKKKPVTVTSVPSTTSTAVTPPPAVNKENPIGSAEKYFEPINYNWLINIVKSSDFSLFFLASYILMSIICFFAYKRDKLSAIKQLQRTPESRLHFYELLGGWPGGLLAQKVLRHKNRKPSYQIEFWLIVSVNVTLTGYILWFQNS